jgi:hypothetical protein
MLLFVADTGPIADIEDVWNLFGIKAFLNGVTKKRVIQALKIG